MSDNGWIKVHRKIMKNVIWDDPLRLKAWLHCILSANHEDRDVFFEHNVVKVKKGQFITSNRKLQKEWGCSTNTVNKILKQLSELGMIEYSTESKRYTLVSLINYGVYQDRVYTHRDTERDSDRDGHRDRERDGEREQTRSNKNYKNDKEVNMASPEEDDDDEEGYVVPRRGEDGEWIV